MNIPKKRRSRSRSWKDLSRGQRKEQGGRRRSPRAHHATYLLQSGDRGYRAMWEHIMRVSVADLKRNYENLNVSFDVWLGESGRAGVYPADAGHRQGQAADCRV